MITLDRAKSLELGEVLHHNTHRNADGTCERWRVNGAPKVWVTRSLEVKVPVKHGLRDYSYVTEHELEVVHLAEECPFA